MDTRGGDQNPFSFVERREEEDPEVRSRVTRRRRSFFSLSFSFSRVFVDDRKMMMMFASCLVSTLISYNPSTQTVSIRDLFEVVYVYVRR